MESSDDTLLGTGRGDDYVSSLCKDGPNLWFEMHIPRLIAQLAPLSALPPKTTPPLRLQILSESLNPAGQLETIEGLYRALSQEGDPEGASIAAGAAVSWIWDRGNDFSRLDVWGERIDRLLETDSLSPLARASLFGWKATIGILGKFELESVLASFESGLAWAEKAHSLSLRLYHTAGLAYVCCHTWDISKMEVHLFDAAPLSELEEAPPPCKSLFKIIMSIKHLFRKKPLESIRTLQEIENDPLFEMLPLSIWLFVYSQHCITATSLGDMAQMERLAEIIQRKAVPEENHLHHSHTHVSLGMASLMLENPYKAFLHSKEASKRAELCGSHYSTRHSALLEAQALVELNRMDEAEQHLLIWLERWRAAGHHFFTVPGLFEMVNLQLKKKKIEQARLYYNQIIDLYSREHFPSGCIPYFRPIPFYEKIEQTFNPEAIEVGAWSTPESAKIRIEAFGGLRAHIEDRLIQEKMWRGSRTKLLLKAIVVHGGAMVPSDLLADLLWPDADGDIAAGNLKVTLSRLRRIGYGKDDKPPSWIEMKNKRVSLAKHLCSVDSIRFVQMLCDAENKSQSEELLLKALDLYTDDFLVHDINEEWIIGHRLYLRDAYVKGVMTLCDRTLNNGRFDTVLPHLQRAIDKDPLNESLYVRLMRAFIDQGFPSDAVLVFNRAKEAFQKELGIQPGPALTGLARRVGAIK